MWLSTTIKKKWMDKILSGEKTSETKVASQYWNNRINKIIETPLKLDGINFLCGQKCYKYEILDIIWHNDATEIDGFPTQYWWEIVLGKRIKHNEDTRKD